MGRANPIDKTRYFCIGTFISYRFLSIETVFDGFLDSCWGHLEGFLGRFLARFPNEKKTRDFGRFLDSYWPRLGTFLEGFWNDSGNILGYNLQNRIFTACKLNFDAFAYLWEKQKLAFRWEGIAKIKLSSCFRMNAYTKRFRVGFGIILDSLLGFK